MMMARLASWRRGLTSRERRMVYFAAAITALVVLVYGVVLPVGALVDAAAVRHTDAVRRSARLVEAVRELDRGNRRMATRGDIAQFVAASAQAGGLVAQSVDRQGSMRVHAVITGATAAAAFGWIEELGRAGLVVERLSARQEPGGTIALDLVVRR